jgi:hypothetical protein
VNDKVGVEKSQGEAEKSEMKGIIREDSQEKTPVRWE